MTGGAYGLFEGSLSAFTGRDWWNTPKTSG